MADAHKNFAYSTLANSPGTAGTSFIVQTGDGTKFPAVQFNATVWPAGVQPTGGSGGNSEIVRVTAISTDTFTVTRNAESGGATSINAAAGYQIAAAITAKTFTDIEANYVNSWAPFLIQTGTNVQTFYSTSASSTGSLYVFPFSLQSPVKFNQILLAQSLAWVGSAATQTISNTYYSLFGLYSLASSSILNLISSNSFSISEIYSQSSTTNATLAWSYPTSTATSGYAYGSFPAAVDTPTKISLFVSGTRVVGLQFGGEMSLSGGQYWLGLLHLRSTAVSAYGLSNAGIIGQVVNPLNQPGNGNGAMPLGLPAADWGNKNTIDTGWHGRIIGGFITNTTLPNFNGTRIPTAISMSEIGANAGAITILPSITLVST